ncbi:MAG: DUF6159 family protein [Ignavibacteria bacterium]|jgi:hypothetical protein
MFYKKIKAKDDDIFKNKLELANESKDIFRKNTGIIFYPILGALLSISTFVFLIMISKGSGAVVLALLIWYLLLNILIVFFNTATVACTKIALNGKKPKFSDGIREAFKRTNMVINWALFNSVLGIFMNFLAEIKATKGYKYTGEIVWSFVSYFILPIMVFENKDVKSAIDESQKLIKKNWGRNISGEYKISFISMVPFLIVLLVLIFSSVLKDEYVTYGLFIFTIFILIIGFLMNFSLRSIFYTALYMNVKGKVKKQ